MRGVVQWFNDSKGYGLIHADGSDELIFAHYSNIQGDGFKTLSEGQEVEFERVEGSERRSLGQMRKDIWAKDIRKGGFRGNY